MELNLSELTLTSFNSIQLNLTKFTAVNNLVTVVAMGHIQSKPTVSKAHLRTLNLSNFKMIETMGLNIIASMSP
jgi:hypothetical protein